MRRPADLLRLFGSVAFALAAAGPAHALAQAECEPRRRSCVAQCRAQYFTVDPRRDACVAKCAAEADRCAREQAGR